MAAAAMNRLKPIWVQNKLSLPTKIRVYTTCILPLLLYGCETWTLVKSDWRRLDSFHMRCQRQLLRVHWSDFIRNAEITERTTLEDLGSTVRRRRLKFFGHRARMPASVPANAALRTSCLVRHGIAPSPGWKRPRGRPSSTWVYQVCQDCDMSATEAFEAAQDRSRWRVIATAQPAMRQ